MCTECADLDVVILGARDDQVMPFLTDIGVHSQCHHLRLMAAQTPHLAIPVITHR